MKGFPLFYISLNNAHKKFTPSRSFMKNLLVSLVKSAILRLPRKRDVPVAIGDLLRITHSVGLDIIFMAPYSLVFGVKLTEHYFIIFFIFIEVIISSRIREIKIRGSFCALRLNCSVFCFRISLLFLRRFKVIIRK